MNLQNLVNYCEEFQLEDIFSGVSVPEPLDPEDVKSAIMLKCGLLAPVYAEPSTFREMCTFWFKSHRWNIEHLINIILAEYSPIENFDRYEHVTTDRAGKEVLSGSDTNTASGSDSLTHGKTITTQHGHNIENQVSAFNSSTYSNSEKEIHSGSDVDSVTGSDTTNYGKIDTNTYGKNTDTTGKEVTTSHLHGNIGVTTNQQMINQELELLKSFNIYEWIASRFEDDLFLTVY